MKVNLLKKMRFLERSFILVCFAASIMFSIGGITLALIWIKHSIFLFSIQILLSIIFIYCTVCFYKIYNAFKDCRKLDAYLEKYLKKNDK